jgi:hypothetical protein
MSCISLYYKGIPNFVLLSKQNDLKISSFLLQFFHKWIFAQKNLKNSLPSNAEKIAKLLSRQIRKKSLKFLSVKCAKNPKILLLPNLQKNHLLAKEFQKTSFLLHFSQTC